LHIKGHARCTQILRHLAYIKGLARCTQILMHDASSSINKNVVSHGAHWFISVYDLLLKLVKNIHLVSNKFWNPQTKFLKPQNRKYVTPNSRFLKNHKYRKYV
jgi:hypothetical protein